MNGANRVGQSEAAAATGLSVGGTYVDGRRAVRAARARAPLPQPRLSGRRGRRFESTVDAGEGRVDVAVTVDEGARHVVHSVRTTGVESTREATRGTGDRGSSQDRPRAQLSPKRPGAGSTTSARSAPPKSHSPRSGTRDQTPRCPSTPSSRSRNRAASCSSTASRRRTSTSPLFDQRVTSGGVAADLRDRNFLGRGWTLGAGLRYEPSFRSARVLTSVPADRIQAHPHQRLCRHSHRGARPHRRRHPPRRRDGADDRAAMAAATAGRAVLGLSVQRPRHQFRGRATRTRAVIDFDGLPRRARRRHRRRPARQHVRREAGWLFSTSAEWGLRALGSDFDYLRTLVRGSYYQPRRSADAGLECPLGQPAAFGGQPPVSVLDIFYQAGGTQTVRGYKQDSLSAYTSGAGQRGRSAAPSCSCSTRRSGSRCSGC